MLRLLVGPGAALERFRCWWDWLAHPWGGGSCEALMGGTWASSIGGTRVTLTGSAGESSVGGA
ncbi:hypothetical protein ACFYXF_45770 [Streptomyces sp. NPDC002680]|uniref:hypothetical protein n=1 Tax=Streptomyces sp. NPDC002680 TaxID=3364659 RepID=UPI00367529DA